MVCNKCDTIHHISGRYDGRLRTHEQCTRNKSKTYNRKRNGGITIYITSDPIRENYHAAATSRRAIVVGKLVNKILTTPILRRSRKSRQRKRGINTLNKKHMDQQLEQKYAHQGVGDFLMARYYTYIHTGKPEQITQQYVIMIL